MKKVLCILLAVMFVLSVAACGGGNEPDPADGAEYNLKIGTYFSGAQGGGEFAQKFSDRVSELSDGKITIDVHQDSQLGSQSELTEAISQGTVDFMPNDWAMFDTVLGYSKGAIFGLPYMFSNWDQVKAFYGSDIFTEMTEELLENHDIRFLGAAADGFRQVYSQDRIETVEDFKSYKIRVPDISVYIDTFHALGAAATIVPGAELYTSLQNGIVNGLERPADGFVSNNLHEQTKYVIKTDHIFVDVSLFVSETTFQKLDEDAQAIILQAGKEVSEEHFEYMRGRDQDAIDKLVSEYKQELVEFDTTEMKEICKDKVWPKYIEKIEGGQEIADYIQTLA